METVVKIMLILFSGTFLISCFLYFLGRRKFNRDVMNGSTIFILIMTGLLVLSLIIAGTIFTDIPHWIDNVKW